MFRIGDLAAQPAVADRLLDLAEAGEFADLQGPGLRRNRTHFRSRSRPSQSLFQQRLRLGTVIVEPL